RLPDPSGLPGAAGTEYVGPGNETESKLVSIWQEVLGREQVGIKDNFFELGGHSLKAAQVISKINKHFLVRINIQTLFKDPTIENIAAQIDFILDQNRQKPNKEKLIKIEL
ncbi:MAG TPA: phosphopantetheine-binding protein, partial [Puia sp.]